MKLYIIFAFSIASVVCEPFLVLPGAVTLETHEEAYAEQQQLARAADSQKAASATIAKKGEFTEFCYLSISFFQKSQTCGCTIWDKRYVVTSARCVRDCAEGVAANITVTIPAASGKEVSKKIEAISIPDGTNGAGRLEAYSIEDGVPDFRTITANNVAIIKLSSDIVFPTTSAVRKAKVTIEGTLEAWQTAHKATDGWKLRACGVGVINNKGERSKGVACVDVNLAGNQCPKLVPSDPDPATLPGNQVCLSWPDRDNNVCVGDFGGPVYAYKLDPKGNIDGVSQEFFCILVGSPNVRNNAQCLDGHSVICEPVFDANQDKTKQGWFTAIIDPPPPTT